MSTDHTTASPLGSLNERDDGYPADHPGAGSHHGDDYPQSESSFQPYDHLIHHHAPVNHPKTPSQEYGNLLPNNGNNQPSSRQTNGVFITWWRNCDAPLTYMTSQTRDVPSFMFFSTFSCKLLFYYCLIAKYDSRREVLCNDSQIRRLKNIV